MEQGGCEFAWDGKISTRFADESGSRADILVALMGNLSRWHGILENMVWQEQRIKHTFREGHGKLEQSTFPCRLRKTRDQNGC